MNRRTVGRWLGAFAVASLVVALLLPAYSQHVLALAALKVNDALFGLEIGFTPSGLLWRDATVRGRVNFYLVAYNTALLLTAAAALPMRALSMRAWVLAAGLPLLFLCHVADLVLSVESSLLTATRPDSYDLLAGLDLWFLAVKFANNLNVLALRQLVPLAIAVGLWRWISGREDAASAASP